MNQTRRSFIKNSALVTSFASVPIPGSFFRLENNLSYNSGMPFLPYGAVYFRKSNPPKEDWERDYKQAAADGMNAFRHWFLWAAIETSPGKYDWDDYDRQLDLAAKYGIKTIVAEITSSSPQWAYTKY
ncbi:MAG: beta-galactosidase, partial [Draconibacterium sp.]|nr:beta-galactosidase [Draconibacterium sp.]